MSRPDCTTSVRRRRTVVFALLCLLSLGTLGCKSMIVESLLFFPMPHAEDAPPGGEDVFFEASDGVRLHAWHAPAKPGWPTLLWSHGNGGNIAGRRDVFLAFTRAGLGVFAYDYRGYGRSEGSPSIDGVELDAEAAYDELRRRGVAAEDVVIFGESLGGAVSVGLAAKHRCRALAVVSTFPSMGAIARHHYGPLGALAKGAFDSASRIGGVGVPIFMAHGDRDEIAPIALGRALYEAAPEPKRFLVAEGFGHNDIFASSKVMVSIIEFARDPRTAGKAS